MAGGSAVQSGPMSVKEISEKAEDFEFNPSIALKYWLRTADTLLREALIYEQEHNDQQAFLLLMRYATLVAYRLPTHPSAREKENRAALRAVDKSLPKVLDQLEQLKPRINARHDAWKKALQRRGGVKTVTESQRPTFQTQSDLAASDPAVAGNNVTLAAAENSDLAVRLAHKEIRRRETRRKAAQKAGLSTGEEQERHKGGVRDDWESTSSKKPQSRDEEDETRRNMQNVKRRMDEAHGLVPEGAKKNDIEPLSRSTRPLARREGSEYRYPSIQKPQPLGHDATESLSRTTSPTLYIPPLPPKERLEMAAPNSPPTVPEKYVSDESRSMSPVNSPPFTFRPSAYLESGNPLRTVFLPQKLRQKFLEVAEPNTRRNLETCGMLCGTLISNALFISKVVIPEQESTSDTCDTINESGFFDFCAAEDLMVLGWIHTHPTQTCFMSSRDLHTHCGYQIMMPESIAIVCAPSKTPSWGVFRLTDPPGMQSVLGCRQTGLFHPHDEPNVYTDALRPGHVFEADGMDFELVDLRPQ